MWPKLLICVTLIALAESGRVEDMKKVLYNDAVCEMGTCSYNIYLDPSPGVTRWRQYKNPINVNISIIPEELLASVTVKQGSQVIILMTNPVEYQHGSFDCFNDAEDLCRRISIEVMRGDVSVYRDRGDLYVRWCPLVFIKEYRVGPRPCFMAKETATDYNIDLIRSKIDYYWIDFTPYERETKVIRKDGTIVEDPNERFKPVLRDQKKRPPAAN